MKGWIVAVAAGGIVVGGLSADATDKKAEKKVEDITCEEFLAMSPENQNRIAYWVDGYFEGKNESATSTVALDKFGQPIGALIEDCKATPKETLWQKLKKHL